MSDPTSAHCERKLERTPLYDLHLSLGARIAPFAGYAMPIHYPTGILKEHLHTRAAAGLFDVSHMGQIAVYPKSGDVAEAALSLERLMPVDIKGLQAGRQRYGFFTNTQGGILDDLMVANCGDHLLLIVNAACKTADEAHLNKHLSDACQIERLDHALLALQGPTAEAALTRLAPECAAMRFMDVRALKICGVDCIVARSGYTGEDGFEISLPFACAAQVASALLTDPNVAPVGLGARDSLRLEAGLCLYGSDVDPNTTPVGAKLDWAIQSVRRSGGEREGGFPGSETILQQLADRAARTRVGLRPNGRAPVRGGSPIFADEDSLYPIGTTTSGAFGPSLDCPVAMGYVPVASSAPGTVVFAEVRSKRLPMIVTALPFITPKFKRGIAKVHQ